MSPTNDVEQMKRMSKEELRKACIQSGLSPEGLKTELQQRLIEWVAASSATSAKAAAAKTTKSKKGKNPTSTSEKESPVEDNKPKEVINLTVERLREELRKRGLPSTGNKAELLTRYTENPPQPSQTIAQVPEQEAKPISRKKKVAASEPTVKRSASVSTDDAQTVETNAVKKSAASIPTDGTVVTKKLVAPSKKKPTATKAATSEPSMKRSVTTTTTNVVDSALDLESLDFKTLRAMCREAGLPSGGNKNELLVRLRGKEEIESTAPEERISDIRTPKTVRKRQIAQPLKTTPVSSLLAGNVGVAATVQIMSAEDEEKRSERMKRTRARRAAAGQAEVVTAPQFVNEDAAAAGGSSPVRKNKRAKTEAASAGREEKAEGETVTVEKKVRKMATSRSGSKNSVDELAVAKPVSRSRKRVPISDEMDGPVEDVKKAATSKRPRLPSKTLSQPEVENQLIAELSDSVRVVESERNVKDVVPPLAQAVNEMDMPAAPQSTPSLDLTPKSPLVSSRTAAVLERTSLKEIERAQAQSSEVKIKETTISTFPTQVGVALAAAPVSQVITLSPSVAKTVSNLETEQNAESHAMAILAVFGQQERAVDQASPVSPQRNASAPSNVESNSPPSNYRLDRRVLESSSDAMEVEPSETQSSIRSAAADVAQKKTIFPAGESSLNDSDRMEVESEPSHFDTPAKLPTTTPTTSTAIILSPRAKPVLDSNVVQSNVSSFSLNSVPAATTTGSSTMEAAVKVDTLDLPQDVSEVVDIVQSKDILISSTKEMAAPSSNVLVEVESISRALAGEPRYSTSGVSFATANEEESLQKSKVMDTTASGYFQPAMSQASDISDAAVSAPTMSNLVPPASVQSEQRYVKFAQSSDSVEVRDAKLLDDLETALLEATMGGITRAEFEVLDAVLQSFCQGQAAAPSQTPKPKTPGLNKAGVDLDGSFMHINQPTPKPSAPMSGWYMPTPIQPPSFRPAASSAWRRSALKATGFATTRPPVPLFSPSLDMSKMSPPFSKPNGSGFQSAITGGYRATQPTPKTKGSHVAETIRKALKEDQSVQTSYAFSPPPSVKWVPRLMRQDLQNTSLEGVTQYQFDN